MYMPKDQKIRKPEAGEHQKIQEVYIRRISLFRGLEEQLQPERFLS
jgi:hypothetical protein